MKSTEPHRKYLSHNVKLYSTITPGQETQKLNRLERNIEKNNVSYARLVHFE